MLIIFSGGSGVGKNTVISHLLQDSKFALMPTYTSRAKRESESEGNPYHFLTDEEFEKKIEEGEFYEYEKVHGHYYGTSKKLLKKGVESGKILLKDIDVLGTQNLIKRAGEHVKIVAIYLKVDSSDILAERLKGRGEKEIELRLSRYAMEEEQAINYDYIINNYDLDNTLSIVSAIIEREKENRPLSISKKISGERVNKIMKNVENDERLKPIKIRVQNGELCIVKGAHRYLASLALKRRIAKEIVT